MSVMEERPVHSRSKSATFSLKSDKSGSSKNSKPKFSFGRETHEEKERQHLSEKTKANPNAAMNEAEPVAAQLAAPTIESLRSIQHVDAFGNPIAEPDLSNPTRPRWERPLDTIRSFEAAIDTEYKRRSMAQTRPGTAMFSDSGIGFQSRRNSYFGMDNYQQQARYSQAGSQAGGYYGRNRDSYAEDGGNGNSYGPPPPMSPPGRMRPERRQYSEPANLNRFNGPPGPSGPPTREGMYPSPGWQRSRDTVNSNGSHSQSEPWTNNTDPSSENSSIDRIQAAPKADQVEQYGFTGLGGKPFNNTIHEEMTPYGEPPMRTPHGPGNGPNGGYYNQVSQGPPQPPPHNYAGNQQKPRNTLIKLSSNQGAPPVPSKDGVQVTASPALQSAPSQKKKGWLKRRFSKKE